MPSIVRNRSSSSFSWHRESRVEARYDDEEFKVPAAMGYSLPVVGEGRREE
jgi:hypothetical protein